MSERNAGTNAMIDPINSMNNRQASSSTGFQNARTASPNSRPPQRAIIQQVYANQAN